MLIFRIIRRTVLRMLAVSGTSIVIFAATGEDVLHADERITPQRFNWIASTSLDIVKTMHAYADQINTTKPDFFFDIDLVKTTRNTYSLPTSRGIQSAEIMQYDGALYFDWSISSNYTLDFFVVANGIGLGKNLYSAPAKDVWSSEYSTGSIAVRRNDKSLYLAFGYNDRKIPYTEKNSAGNEVFGYLFNSSTSEWERAETETQSCFASVKAGQYELTLVYSFSSQAMELLSARIEFWLGKEFGIFVPGANYYKENDTKQIGTSLIGFKLGSSLSLATEGYLNTRSFALDYLLASGTLLLFRDEDNSSLQHDPAKRFSIVANTGISYSKEIFPSGLFGYSAQLTVENIPLLGSRIKLIAGISCNYHESLYRLPIQDEVIVRTGAQISW